MKIKKFLVTCVAFASLSLVMADSAKSFANDTYLVTDKSDAVAVADISGEELDDFFSEVNIDEDTAMLLLQKLDEGQLWDSLTGAMPVHVETIETDSQIKQIYRYADGSATVTRMVIASSPGEDSRGVSGCVTTSSSSYHENQINCYANVDFGLIQMGFHFDRNTYRNAPGVITAYYGMSSRGIGVALSSHRLDKFSNQTVRYSAEASMIVKGSPVQWTAWMQVTLGNGLTATVTNN